MNWVIQLTTIDGEPGIIWPQEITDMYQLKEGDIARVVVDNRQQAFISFPNNPCQEDKSPAD